ncbi:MAG TPA: nucleoside-diphosphate sugar epimerase/dehydratase [Terriglobales bacterium]|nr:nucleoside-diphosphate sugar epimerase/dehydratase [Terriglobales bacterium]
MSILSTPRLQQQSVDRGELNSAFLRYRTWLIIASQIVLIISCYYCSFGLRLDWPLNHADDLVFWRTLPLILVVKLLIFHRFGLLRGWWRYVGMSDVLNIAEAAGLSAAVIYAVVVLGLGVTGYPRSVVFIDMALSMIFVGGARFVVRAYTERARRYDGQKNTLIVGAGQAGRTIAQQLRSNAEMPYFTIGFVDDDPSKLGLNIGGLKVLGTTNNLSELITKYQAECVLIAIPSARGPVVQQIIDKCRESKVTFRILPPISEMLDRTAPVRASIQQTRKLRIEDLLGRQPVRLELDRIRERVQDKVLLITGAGGSIGSELARQVAIFRPRQLVLLDRSENDLFKVGMELSRKFPDLNYVPVVGDILDVSRLREVFSLYRPSSVFHAAAYKHVPMMERNCFQAVTNNVFGTYNVALLARQAHAEDFVLISSDKAVNPTNIMGVTKRIAELIVLALQHNKTRFMAVRFGNVLGSNGSVLPIFEEQIASGGPVTVTHPEAKRYFMTVTEAVQLVLQASTMGQGGEIFVLDMGEPVNIADLAKRMVRLAGLEPGRDVEVVFTGLRPGEKLFEELKLDGENIKPTPHEKIRVFEGGTVAFEQVRTWLEDLSSLVDARNVHELVAKLVSIVPEYWPSSEIIELSEVDRHDQSLAYRRARNLLASSAKEIA